MPKLEDVVIPMQQNFNDLTYVIGNSEILNRMPEIPAMSVFDDRAIAFLNALSASLLKKGKAYSDVITFAFWCRKAALMQEKNKYNDISQRLGKGIVFHSTPSNVPVNFAFSFAAGILAGNANIIRLPAKDFAQVSLICNAIGELLENDFEFMKPYILMVKFPPIKEITDMFSAISDARVVWGGDMTISIIRQSPLKPRANEITFADRYSILVINADAYLAYENKDKIIQNFYNDTYFSDQNACTAPRIIFWQGNEIGTAKKDFWNRVEQKAYNEYDLSAIQAIGKLSNLFKTATHFDIKKISGVSNFVTRVSLSQLSSDILEYKYNSGFFFEYDILSLKDILPVCTSKCQTLTYFGLTQQEIQDFVCLFPQGVDRIVPIGQSMDFSLVWDGHDLIRELSRCIKII